MSADIRMMFHLYSAFAAAVASIAVCMVQVAAVSVFKAIVRLA